MSEEQGIVDFHHPPTSTDPDVLYSILDLQVASYLSGPESRELLAKAYARAAELHGGQNRDSGEPYIAHPLHVALILSHMRPDIDILAAALLHDVLEDTTVTRQQLAEEFGGGIADLVEGVTKLTQVSRLSRDGQSAANIRKVFVAMSEDIRVMFIKLADRLHNLRTLGSRRNPYSRRRTATEALEVYARIADRLGIAILRKEMEDIAFSYLDPDAYARVKQSIEVRYQESPERVEAIGQRLLGLLADRDIHTVGFGVQPNPRKVYDMYRRLQEEQNPSSGKPKRVPPQLRFHVLVEDVPSCYMAMAAIHAVWPPIASETRDYISAPLPNGYRSFHTTVFIDQQPVKFQIRTMLMHRMSQLGIIAYLQEGERSAVSPELRETVDELRRLGTEAIREFGDPVEFLTSLKREILGDEMYVYTPRHKVIQLAVGSTPIDFAFRIHTMVGHQCRGALVDGHWVPLNRPLRTGERVEILTVDDVGPCFEWLDPDLGYTHSSLAQGKIRRWFRRRPDEEKMALGREQVRKIVDRFSLEVQDLSALAKRMGYASEQELVRDIGGCDLPMERVLHELLDVYGTSQLPAILSDGVSSLPIVGVGSLDSCFASCCKPQAGDAIVGYILAPQHIVEVHRSDCPELLGKLVEDRTRLVEVRWGRVSETFLACMRIYAHDRPFFLRDVWNIIWEEEINVADVDVQVNRARDATITICIDVEDWLQFHRVLTRVGDLPGTISVTRMAIPDGTLDEIREREAL